MDKIYLVEYEGETLYFSSAQAVLDCLEGNDGLARYLGEAEVIGVWEV